MRAGRSDGRSSSPGHPPSAARAFRPISACKRTTAVARRWGPEQGRSSVRLVVPKQEHADMSPATTPAAQDISGRAAALRRACRPRRCTAGCDMLLIREFEVQLQAYQQAKIGGFCHFVHRPGGVRRRDHPGRESRRSGDHGVPRPRARARTRHGRQGLHGRDVRKATGCMGQGRVDAHVRQAQLALRRARDRWGPDAAGRGLAFAAAGTSR